MILLCTVVIWLSTPHGVWLVAYALACNNLGVFFCRRTIISYRAKIIVARALLPLRPCAYTGMIAAR